MQELLVVIILVAALLWLGLRLFRACRSDSCKDCPGCGTARPPAAQPADSDNHDCG